MKLMDVENALAQFSGLQRDAVEQARNEGRCLS